MANINWRLDSPLENTQAIDALETQYGFTLPDSLRQLIIAHNAAFPKPDRCAVPGLGERDVKMLLSYNPDDPETVYDVFEFFFKRSRGRLIPFASDSGSGYYCLSGAQVVYIDENELASHVVAQDFASFWDGLFE